MGRKMAYLSLIGFLICLLSLWITRGTEAAGVERNPFAFPPGVQKGPLPTKAGGAAEKTARESAPLFRVTTILISGKTKVAAVNGALLRLGDELSGYRLVEVEEKQVTLSKGKEKVVVKIDPTEKVFFRKTAPDNRTMGFSK